MPRLCERPGCSAPAAVAYGMEHEHLLVWLEAMPDGTPPPRANVVCRRHADAMVVPRGWTLDDRRESRPRLFKVVETAPARHHRGARTARTHVPGSDDQSQLSFDQLDERERAEELIDAITVGEIRPVGEFDPDETQAMPWRPVFDAADDLGGLLSAKSPLLSRAFHGRSRTD